MNYRMMIFDFDYTLGDSTAGIVLSANYALEKLGVEPKDQEQIKKTVGLTLKNTYAELANDTEEEKAILFQKYFREKANDVMTTNTDLLPYTLDVFKRLKEENCKVGIVTTKLHCRIQEILEKFQATDYVDMIIGAEDVVVEKPSPEGLLYMIQAMEVRKQEVLYIGDSLIDAMTAKNAGVDFVGVTTGTTSKEEFLKYPHKKILENLERIVEI
ncbi:MAG: HAD family hydrolase [Lachnospiraceae bacterium]|nr:HAD family hydrolase [Lachnospiraceae bacterium]